MATTYSFSGLLVLESCCKCGVAFGLDSHHKDQLKRDHTSFYCPNGHGQHYTAETEAERMRRERDRAQASASYWRSNAESAKRSAAASRGVVTKLKRKISRGQCPCCKREFADLGRHMAGQHPDFATETE